MSLQYYKTWFKTEYKTWQKLFLGNVTYKDKSHTWQVLMAECNKGNQGKGFFFLFLNTLQLPGLSLMSQWIHRDWMDNQIILCLSVCLWPGPYGHAINIRTCVNKGPTPVCLEGLWKYQRKLKGQISTSVMLAMVIDSQTLRVLSPVQNKLINKVNIYLAIESLVGVSPPSRWLLRFVSFTFAFYTSACSLVEPPRLFWAYLKFWIKRKTFSAEKYQNGDILNTEDYLWGIWPLEPVVVEFSLNYQFISFNYFIFQNNCNVAS